MEKRWYQRWFSRPASAPPVNPQAQAELGDAEAQFALGVQYGASAPQDFPQAAVWYRKAADQNHLLAQFNLGVMLANGQGMPKDQAAATGWFRRAAEGGDAGAQFNLGNNLHRASLSGLPADASESRIESYKWLSLAGQQGYKTSAASRALLTVGMTRAEVTEGNQRAARFQPANGSTPA